MNLKFKIQYFLISFILFGFTDHFQINANIHEKYSNRIDNDTCISFLPLLNRCISEYNSIYCPYPDINYTSIAPIIDQYIDACWSAASVGSFTNVVNGTMQSDFSGSTWRALYDSYNLYLLVEIKDNSKINDSGNWWEDDAIEVYIDGDNSKGTAYDDINDFQYGFRYNDPSVIHLGTNSIANTAGVLFSIQNVSGGYNMEISIPWSTIGVAPSNGYQIGLDVEVDDDDYGGSREAHITAFDNTGEAWIRPNVFGTFTLCNTAPEVSINQAISQSDPSGNSTINFTATFSEEVTGFDSGDISLGGSAGATNVVITGSGAVYNIAVSGMTNDGTVIVSMNAGGCTDLEGNYNIPSTSTDNIVNYETIKPVPTINLAVGQTNPATVSPVNFQINFSEDVTGFTDSDVNITGSAGATSAVVSGSGSSYTISVIGMSKDGDIVITLDPGVCSDLAGNLNTTSVNTANSVIFNADEPTVSIEQSSSQSDPVNILPVQFNIVCSKNITDLDFNDISWTGSASGITGSISGSGQNYTLTITSVATDGTLIPSIITGQIHDDAGIGNSASISTDNSVTYDNTSPSVTLVRDPLQNDPTNSDIISFDANFSEAVANFEINDVQLSGTAGATDVYLRGGPGNYIIDVSGMTKNGTVTVNIPANVAKDYAGNSNLASDNISNTVTYDALKPDPVLSTTVQSPTHLNQIPISISFSEPVSGFDLSDLNINNGVITNLTEESPMLNWTALIIPDRIGMINIQMPAGVVVDMGGNPNNASNHLQIEYLGPVVVTINVNLSTSVQGPTHLENIPITISFTEQVTGLSLSDFTVTNATITNLSEQLALMTWNAEIIPTSTGIISIQLPAGMVSDTYGNVNLASNILQIEYLGPEIITIETILSTTTEEPTYSDRIPFTVSFTQAVTGISVSDFTITNGTVTDITEQVATETWNAYIIPERPGIVEIQVQDGVVDDGKGNTNLASNILQFEYLGPDPKAFKANNIFSPNSSFNRYWKIQNVDRYWDYELVIRNASGQEVYKTLNYKNDWNGTYNNKPLPTGTYYYIFTSPDKKCIFKGFINILYE